MALDEKKGAVFSTAELKRHLEKEEKHGIKIVATQNNQPLATLSSGEQKKALLGHVLEQQPDFLVLVNPYDNLDISTVIWLKKRLVLLSERLVLVQFSNRLEDILPIEAWYYLLERETLQPYPSLSQLRKQAGCALKMDLLSIPAPLHTTVLTNPVLIRFKAVSVSFHDKAVLQQITWTVKQGEFWQLIGPNGSGKSTLLAMITGDSHKGYGQDLELFGMKKGGGESVWDIKKNIGYFTPTMTLSFKGYHTLEHMLVSGLHDSVGLYVKPSETELRLAHSWLRVLGLFEKRNTAFRQVSTGEKRLVMTARAMIKHPLLLILDEPTVGLDDGSAHFFVQLVNQYAKESKSALIYVSHREEPHLKPKSILGLTMTSSGSVGKIGYI